MLSFYFYFPYLFFLLGKKKRFSFLLLDAKGLGLLYSHQQFVVKHFGRWIGGKVQAVEAGVCPVGMQTDTQNPSSKYTLRN